MWNADNGNCLNVFSGHGAIVTCGGFTPDGTNVSSFSPIRSLALFSPLFCISLSVYRIFNMYVIYLGKTICTGSEDATLRVWNPRSGESIHVIRGIHLESNFNVLIEAQSEY